VGEPRRPDPTHPLSQAATRVAGSPTAGVSSAAGALRLSLLCQSLAVNKRVREIEWDAIAGVVAAVVALVLHLLGVVDTGVLLAVLLVLTALMLIRDLRREAADDRAETLLHAVATDAQHIRSQLVTPEVVLIGPRRLRTETERFARSARGEMTWFNVCLDMFIPQAVFDAMLRPAIENPAVTRIQFLIDTRELEKWNRIIVPKVAECAGAAKVAAPMPCAMTESLSFILAETDTSITEALLSFWGEPFMSSAAGRDIPRYIFRVDGSSELIARFVDLERNHRAAPRPRTGDQPSS
jgi:hypothetical protein